jgi:hypothetical protein
VWRETPAWPEVLAPELLAAYARTAKDPVRRPATAAPAITALDGFMDEPFLYLVDVWSPPRLDYVGRRRSNNSLSYLYARRHISKKQIGYSFIP